jgi:CheY-like chemotaxis protein
MGQVKVLVVEDDNDCRDVIVEFMEWQGFEVQGAKDGADAIAHLATFHPDVILLDLVMPGMSGFEFLQTYPGPVPVVVMSAWSGHVELPRQPYAVVAKPWAFGTLQPILQEAAKSRRK